LLSSEYIVRVIFNKPICSAKIFYLSWTRGQGENYCRNSMNTSEQTTKCHVSHLRVIQIWRRQDFAVSPPCGFPAQKLIRNWNGTEYTNRYQFKVWLTPNTIFCMCNIWVIRRRNVIYLYSKNSLPDQLFHCQSFRIWCH
jgi:hypothetical protein